MKPDPKIDCARAQIVELGGQEFFVAPLALRQARIAVPGLLKLMPRLNAIPRGCAYNPRCPRVFDRCRVERPDLLHAGATRAACWLHDATRGATA